MSQGETTIRPPAGLLRAFPGQFHWIILGASTLAAAATLPGQTLGISVSLDRIIADLGVSRSEASMAYMIGTLGGAAVMPRFGRLLDRFGPRRMGAAAALAFGLACLLLSSAQGWISLLLGFFAVRALGQGALSMVAGHVQALWFSARRGLAAGIASIGGALANTVLPLSLAAAVAGIGWRSTYLSCAGILALGAAPFLLWVLRSHPSQYGLTPEGRPEPAHESPESGLTLREARRTGPFWSVLGSGVLLGAVATALLFHNFDIAAQQGLSRAEAAALFGPMAVMGAVMNLVGGVAADRRSPMLLVPLSMGLLAAACLLSQNLRSAGGMAIYGGLMGASMGLQGAIGSVAYPRFFGVKFLGEIKGFAFFAGVAGSAVAPPAFAWLQEATGGYLWAAVCSAVLAAALGLAALHPRMRRI